MKTIFKTTPINIAVGIEVTLSELPQIGDYVDMGSIISFESGSSEEHEKVDAAGKEMTGVVKKRMWYRDSKNEMKMMLEVELIDKDAPHAAAFFF